jgi:ComF family protein
MPRTWYERSPYDNMMNRLYWKQIPIEKAAALFFYNAQAPVSKAIYDLKYHHCPEIGVSLGEMTAREFCHENFFEDIDVIIPVPLTRKRQHHRGYNQSLMIAKGISNITGIKINDKIVKRTLFRESQTHKDVIDRKENVKDAFKIINTKAVANRHILLIDDIVTTGATTIACSQQLMKAEGVRISIISLGFVKP